MSGLFIALYAAATTTTLEPDVPRIVGNPLSWPVFIGAGVALLAFILIGGLVVKRRGEASARRP